MDMKDVKAKVAEVKAKLDGSFLSKDWRFEDNVIGYVHQKCC